MKRIHWTRKLTWKMLLVVAASSLSVAIILMLCYFSSSLLLWLNPSSSFFGTKLLRWVIQNISSAWMMIFIGILLFIVFFFIYINSMVRRLDDISMGLKEITDGELTHHIQVKASDELGDVASQINFMTARLRASIEEERAAMKAKNDLITGVSHDLRTPLTSIIGFLQYIEDDRYKDEVEFRYITSIVYDKSISLKKLIDDLFEYTRITSNEIPLQFERIDLNPLLQQLAEEFVPVLEQAGMRYRIQTTDTPVMMKADAGELIRVYDNLLSNAVRYGSGGQVIDITVIEKDGQATVSVKNYGEPIPARDLPHVFERFYRVDKSRSKDTGGSGLGLAISKSIVEIHGGTISVTSSKKQTEFVTSFPLAPLEQDGEE
ncbi:sensor histidine kinase [Paenibacillus selenitireducens]|nr:HAMP domain-containing sensor histidine kinase [Paenibacillus selenitireducens]